MNEGGGPYYSSNFLSLALHAPQHFIHQFSAYGFNLMILRTSITDDFKDDSTIEKQTRGIMLEEIC